MKYFVKIKLVDMALSRTDAMDRCISKGKRFIEHFHKIYTNPNSQDVRHWVTEMKNFHREVKQIKLKQTSDFILDGDLRDWFFTAGAEPKDFMKSPTNEEIKAYDRFVTSVINTTDVNKSLVQLGIIK